MCMHVCFPYFHRASMKYVHNCLIALDVFVWLNENEYSLADLDSLAQKDDHFMITGGAALSKTVCRCSFPSLWEAKQRSSLCQVHVWEIQYRRS